jgi:hypothetical protein
MLGREANLYSLMAKATTVRVSGSCFYLLMRKSYLLDKIALSNTLYILGKGYTQMLSQRRLYYEHDSPDVYPMRDSYCADFLYSSCAVFGDRGWGI